MPSATIGVQYVNPPAQGKKMGSIKDANGNYYGVQPGMLGLFQQGGTYEIFFEDREFQGKTYHTVKTVKPVTQPAAAAQKIVGDVQRARTNEADAERMWVCALLGHAIQSGQIDLRTDGHSAVIEHGRQFLEDLILIWSKEEIPLRPVPGAQEAQQSQPGQPLNETYGDGIPF